MLKSFIVPVLALELWLISVFVSSVFGFSTNEISPYASRQWQSDDGLPQDDVRALCQTSDGYLCVGTTQGLVRFDGIRFRLMEGGAIAETKNRGRTLVCAGSDNTLWSATEDGTLRLWKDEKVSELQLPTSATNISFTSIFSSRDGALWMGTEFNGLFRFRNGKFAHWNVRAGLAHRSVRSICEDKEGTVWVATAAGVNRFDKNKITKLTTQNGLPHNSIRVVCADRNGNLWIASNFGLTRWKDRVVSNFTKKDGLSDNLISVIFEDRKGTIWVGTLNGLNRLVNGRWLTETRSDGTSYDRVNSIFEDREGNLWIGCRDGLGQLRSRAVTTLTKQQGLTHNTATSVFLDRSTNLWVGFWGGGVNKIENGKTTAYTTHEGLSSDVVLTIHQGRQGDLWFGMDYEGGLTLLRNGKFTQYNSRSGLKDQGIKVLHEDSRSNLWIGTRTALLRFKDGNFSRFTTQDGLPADTIEAMHEDREGRLWIGTTGGLALWQEEKCKAFTTADGLSHDSVTSIYEDPSGALWLGTRGGGLNRWKNGKFTSWTTRHGLFHDQIFTILEDEFGFLWMSSPQGIFRVKKKDLDEFVPGSGKMLSCNSFGKVDGMASVQCKGSDKTAACKTPDGRLWFATAKGVAVVDPGNIDINQLPPPVFIEEVMADKSRVLSIESQTSRPPVARSLDLVLKPGRGELEFHYTALSLRQPEKNRFRYKLEGVDSDWVDAETRRVAYYHNIQPGNYTFHVIGCNNDGVWNALGAKVKLSLLPHFWQTWWFQSSVVIGVGLIFVGAYRLRISRLQEIERLRLRIAADLHDEVGSTVGSISVLSEMLRDFGEMGGEEKKDVAKINQLSMQTASSIREIVWFINPEYDTLHELLLRMKDVAESLLSGIAYRLETPAENLSRKLSLEFRQHFFLIYKESLANIMKHAKASSVEIQLSEKAGEWVLSIRDDGAGFDPNTASKGNGLRNLRRRAAKLNGTLEIESQPGQGTRVQLVVRLAK